MRQKRRPYLKLRQQVVDWILEGQYRDGDFLPSIRELARQSGLNPITVAKAYHGLVTAGILVSRQGIGIAVASRGSERLRAQERARFLEEEWPTIVAEMQRLRLQPAELIERDVFSKEGAAAAAGGAAPAP